MSADNAMMAFNEHLFRKLPYSPEKDFTYIGAIGRFPLVLVVHPDFRARDVKTLLAHVKANPGKVSYASVGNGSPHHLAMEMFKVRTKADLLHVPYKGAAPAMQDVMGGQVPMMFLDLTSGLSVIQSGKVRPLAIGSAKRSPLLPEVPTLAEVGVPDTEVFAFQGLVAPAGLPSAVHPSNSRRWPGSCRNAGARSSEPVASCSIDRGVMFSPDRRPSIEKAIRTIVASGKAAGTLTGDPAGSPASRLLRLKSIAPTSLSTRCDLADQSLLARPHAAWRRVRAADALAHEPPQPARLPDRTLEVPAGRRKRVSLRHRSRRARAREPREARCAAPRRDARRLAALERDDVADPGRRDGQPRLLCEGHAAALSTACRPVEMAPTRMKCGLSRYRLSMKRRPSASIVMPGVRVATMGFSCNCRGKSFSTGDAIEVCSADVHSA